ncbi:hypothetical protein PIB30_007995 [Stylosanthes scabra]|uniref:Uncharacterized protein n=1 Tax=Stylosanthes scabra TaxID=79078 RepID=A0ABU6U4R2_9FABA|nr:hypothetical protein [Stylosanthes scabra]
MDSRCSDFALHVCEVSSCGPREEAVLVGAACPGGSCESGWNRCRSIVHQIRVVPTDHGGWPSQQYLQWWERSCRRRYLSVEPVLRDPRGMRLPDSVPPATTQPRDELVLPHDAPVRGRRARQQRPDARRKGKGVASSSRLQDQPGGDAVTEEVERDR